MERLHLYNGALAIIGVSFGLHSLPPLIAGEQSIPLLLMAVGSTGMIIAAVYESISTDPAEFEISAGALFALAAAACLSLTGTILEFLLTP